MPPFFLFILIFPYLFLIYFLIACPQSPDSKQIINLNYVNNGPLRPRNPLSRLWLDLFMESEELDVDKVRVRLTPKQFLEAGNYLTPAGNIAASVNTKGDLKNKIVAALKRIAYSE